MNLFYDKIIPTNVGHVSIIEVLTNNECSYQLEVNSQELEIQMYHFLSAMTSIALQPKSVPQIRRYLRKVDIGTIEANIKPIENVFNTNTFMQCLTLDTSSVSVKTPQFLIGMPSENSTASTHTCKLNEVRNICECCSAPIIFNYHHFLMPMFSSKSCNAATTNGTINILIADDLRDTLIINAITDEYPMIAPLKDDFPVVETTAPRIIEFTQLPILLKLFHSTSKLKVEFESRQGYCECCGTEQNSFISSQGVLTNTVDFIKQGFNINRDNIKYPYMPTAFTSKGQIKIKPWKNKHTHTWTGLGKFLQNCTDKLSNESIEPAQNIQQFQSNLRFNKPISLGILAYEWNKANIKQKVIEVYSLDICDAARITNISNLINFILSTENKLSLLALQLDRAKFSLFGHDIAFESPATSSAIAKSTAQKVRSDFISQCGTYIYHAIFSDLSDQEQRKTTSKDINKIANDCFERNVDAIEHSSLKALGHISVLRKLLVTALNGQF